MNSDLSLAFARIKPVCDSLLLNPSPEIMNLTKCCVLEVKGELLQEMQLYVLFPVASHLKSKELRNKHDTLRQLVEIMDLVLDKISIHLADVFIKYHTCLLNLIFAKDSPGLVADVSEELMLAVMRCMATLMLQATPETKLELFRTCVPMLAQTIYLAAHIAKLQKLRSLRLAAVICLTTYMGIHPQLKLHKKLETAVIEMATNILPGVVAALQEVATNNDNSGHAVVVASLKAMHQILCLVINDKNMASKPMVSIEDFNKILKDKTKTKNKEPDKKAKAVPAMTKEWYAMAGEKLKTVSQSIVYLQTHEHVKVRLELAVYSYRMLTECSRTMQPSVPYVMDVLIALSKDEYPKVSNYCKEKLQSYFSSISEETRNDTLDSVAENFISMVQSLPRILNNIDSSKKLAALNLLHGYITFLCGGSKPQRLSTALCQPRAAPGLAAALTQGCSLETIGVLRRSADRDITLAVPVGAPWRRLRHLDSGPCEDRLIEICRLLGEAECADVIIDQLLDVFDESVDIRKECVYLCNWIGSAPKADLNLTKRILNKYTEAELWYLPLEVGAETPPTSEETYDVSVYNPSAWERDSIPGLYEGATETRYTEISYATPRVTRTDPNSCANLGEAQNNMVVSCLLTEGVGILAVRLMDDFQPYLLKTLCLVLERVGSKFEMLHLAGLKAINDIALACGHKDVAELIQHNADYFTYQVTTRLKKAWNSKSALQILTVVMEYSDASILTCLYGIVSDVLVQSCDKYHELDLNAYLQVFLTFVVCVQKWFPVKHPPTTAKPNSPPKIDLMQDALKYMNNEDDTERLLSLEEFEKESGKTIEEMYKEDMKKKEEEALDYDDQVTEEKKPIPQHIALTITILKRCLNFIPSKNKEARLLSLQIINQGLIILSEYEDELLPLVHLIWSPFVARFEEKDPVVLRRSVEVLLTMAAVSKDFIKHRTVKEVLPTLYKFLLKSSQDSHLKDKGSAYRSSQAFRLQTATLTSLPRLLVDLGLEEGLDEAMSCVDPYLSNKQPKPLQELAVNFFKTLLEYDHGATWHHLRKLCNNDIVLEPPKIKTMTLQSVKGTPFEPVDKCYRVNIQLIFENKK